MPISNWLTSLKPASAKGVDSDLQALADEDYPFLTAKQTVGQIRQLSDHLGRFEPRLRQAVIGYSLYTRQLDHIQGLLTKPHCRGDCQRPPVGCCNARHCDILSLADVTLYQPTSLSMQLAHAIGAMQRQEDAHAMAVSDRSHVDRYCPYLTATGCTLRLFKSPRCVHYLCRDIDDQLHRDYGENGHAFAAVMQETAMRVMIRTADYINPDVLAVARNLLPPA